MEQFWKRKERLGTIQSPRKVPLKHCSTWPLKELKGHRNCWKTCGGISTKGGLLCLWVIETRPTIQTFTESPPEDLFGRKGSNQPPSLLPHFQQEANNPPKSEHKNRKRHLEPTKDKKPATRYSQNTRNPKLQATQKTSKTFQLAPVPSQKKKRRLLATERGSLQSRRGLRTGEGRFQDAARLWEDWGRRNGKSTKVGWWKQRKKVGFGS